MKNEQDKKPQEPPKYTYCKTRSEWRASYYFLGSKAWNALTKIEHQVVYYLTTCLQFKKLRSGDKFKTCMNNGDIEVSFTKIREKIPMSSKTCSKAIKNIIGVGIAKLTREGQNKQCHVYKLLIDGIGVNIEHQRWRYYSENKNWYHETPKHPNNLVGKEKRWKKGECGNPNYSKSHPTKVNGKD